MKQFPIIMMGFGYVLSICSAADAFIAASFGHVFSEKALLAFLVFGPMLDLKNTLMLFAYFQKRFVFFDWNYYFIGVHNCANYNVIGGGRKWRKGTEGLSSLYSWHYFNCFSNALI